MICLSILNRPNGGKIKCPEQDSNLRHPGLTDAAVTTELPRQPQWSDPNINHNESNDLPGVSDLIVIIHFFHCFLRFD